MRSDARDRKDGNKISDTIQPPQIIIIAAVSDNGVIGKDGTIPWHIPEDLRRFKELTLGLPCVMGRRTYESLPVKPLPGRLNIVISSRPADISGDVRICGSLNEAVAFSSGYEKLFICGGSSVYRAAMQIADRIELTRVNGVYEGDTFFPDIPASDWQEQNRTDYDAFSFLTLTRKHP